VFFFYIPTGFNAFVLPASVQLKPWYLQFYVKEQKKEKTRIMREFELISTRSFTWSQ